jgi:hypothetical protein
LACSIWPGYSFCLQQTRPKFPNDFYAGVAPFSATR